ncbi:MAG: hypothetical protein N3F10_02385 [Candidatus Bathyarchaeota archaeon]|nr:hypothetical protein [Candidatus Bathyarchaeota archaeon]MCX8177131.1 hypothetical protein [Candidatus Bathyarchaeota archaeon]MDW8193699.1 hypothetical protein [Nitrososphaerota archaeon]
MSIQERISRALSAAMQHLERALSADKSDVDALENDVWHVASELEHALLLFSLNFEDNDPAKWRSNIPRKREIRETLTLVYELLKQSVDALSKGKLLDAYKEAYAARYQVFSLQEEFSKKKRKKQEG